LAFGDIAVVNYKASYDGKPLNEAVEEDVGALAESDEYWIKVDKDSFLPGFCEQLEGLEIDGKRDITVTFPDDFPVEDLRGKEGVFAVELTGLKEEVLPELNDEFAATLAPGKTLDEVRELIRENLVQQAEQQRQQIIDNQLLHHVSKEAEFDLPPHIVQNETQRQVNAMVQEIQQQGMSPESLMENQENLIDTASQRAEANVRTNYILQKIAEQEKIEVTNDDLNQEVSMMAYQSGRPPKKVVQEIQKNNGVPEIQNRIMIRKTLELLRANATITEVDPPVADESADEAKA
jgi:trigger factor